MAVERDPRSRSAQSPPLQIEPSRPRSVAYRGALVFRDDVDGVRVLSTLAESPVDNCELIAPCGLKGASLPITDREQDNEPSGVGG
jgi:hypothetical protein